MASDDCGSMVSINVPFTTKTTGMLVSFEIARLIDEAGTTPLPGAPAMRLHAPLDATHPISSTRNAAVGLLRH